MSKVKRILAMLMAMVMIMGMTVVASADVKETATITINNADEADLSYVQVIKADPTTETGWAFTSEAIADCYKRAFGMNDAQVVIRALIDGNEISEAVAKALSNVANSTGVTFAPMKNPQTVTEAGVYAIKGVEDGYTYNNMAAYVGFGEVTMNDEKYEYPSLVDATLEAKKAPTDVEKEVEDADKVVAIGDVLTYTVKTKVPFIDPNAVNKEFLIYDNISGAEYLPFIDGNATLEMGDEDISEYLAGVAMNENGFYIDLSGLINASNSNAGKEIVLTYKAVVTEVTADNKAGANVGGSDYDSDTVNVYTGKITLTKYDEDGETTLAGAGFEVRRIEAGLEETDPLTFDKIDDGVYRYNPEGTVTEVFTGEDGTVVVEGLDIGGYQFTETTAPEGYSINADGAVAVLEVEEDEVATAIIEATTNLKDTKLSSLPSTGGIGTTIFTIGGCAIMIVAAGLFFASRRKAAK